MTRIPLLLLPGLLCDAETWEYQRDHLSDIADIMIPTLNHAASPHEMVASALQAAPPHFAIAGHSMGGWIALEIMKYCPERVLALCLMNTTAFPDSKEKHAARKAMLSVVNKKAEFAAIIAKLTQSFIYNTSVTSQITAMFERNVSAFVNQEQAMLQREDCINVLNSITCPTLIIHSANDTIFHYEDSQFLAEKIKHAALSIIDNCGHMSPMESPDEVTHLMRLWLKTLTLF
jgi:pimeloyl-ACP methyl ester carboxylesterase